MELSHLDENGKAIMVDIGQKPASERVAVATALVRMKAETLALIREDRIKKGDVFACARIAGILAAKRTPELIPMCHPIPITSAAVDLMAVDPDLVEIKAIVRTNYSTGVEMEALNAASVAALTIYHMCKSVDRGMTIEKVQLISKSGGKSGDFIRRKDE